jgi:broad specificity phosphatase PhoE
VIRALLVPTLAAGLLVASPALAARPAPAASGDAATTIFLVRHAEKDAAVLGPDPPLSAAGLARADRLAHALGKEKIAAIYVTEWQRTQLTAAPLRKQLGDTLRVLRGRDYAAQARRIAAESRGRTALVVGHSNTIPELILALTGKPVPPWRETEFDPLYVVVLHRGGSKIVRLNYGDPAPAGVVH